MRSRITDRELVRHARDAMQRELPVVGPLLPGMLAGSDVRRANAGRLHAWELLLPTVALLLETLGAWGLRLVRDHRRIARELEESETRFQSAFETASIGMPLVAPEGTFLDANPALCRLVGYGRDELLRLTFGDITHPDDLRADLGNARELLAGRAETYQTEKRYSRKDGRTVWVLLDVSLVRDARGAPRYFVSQVQDITDRKEAEEQIRELNRPLEERVVLRTRQLEELVGRLIGAQEEERRRVAYEVHDGPTQLVIATHQLLQAFADTHPPGATVEAGALDRPLELARMAVKEARRIIEGLRPAALDDFGLAAALRLLVEDLRAEGWDAGYEETLGDERLAIELETALYRVAQEAINNVRKHAGTTGVRMSLTRTGEVVRLSVRDRGRGFAAEGPRSGGESTGHGERVGLSGMRERVSLLGGTFRVQSKPGSGTRLTAELPLPTAGETGRGGRLMNRREEPLS